MSISLITCVLTLAVFRSHSLTIDDLQIIARAGSNVASLRNENDTHVCAGSIIHEKFVLTTSYCVEYQTITSVVLGATNQENEGTKYTVYRTIDHQNDFNVLPDVALIELSSSIIFTSNISPVELDYSNNNLVDEDVFTFGWGLDNTRPVHLIFMRYAKLKKYDFQTCVDTYGPGYTAEEHVCTSDQSDCIGDLGAPIVSTKGKQIALISSPVFCIGNRPLLNINIAAYRTWIQSTINTTK